MLSAKVTAPHEVRQTVLVVCENGTAEVFEAIVSPC
jgi:hypothetical protein